MHILPPGHPPIPARKTGVLLINLGTPEATDYFSMRRYLKEFLGDRRVIEVNRFVWWFILNGIILNFRPQKSAHAYNKIWNRELNESPLKTFTRAQADGLRTALGAQDELVVDWAMRYGQPALGDKLKEMKEKGCERILLFPLYPQYSGATTATAFDKAYARLQTMRWHPPFALCRLTMINQLISKPWQVHLKPYERTQLEARQNSHRLSRVCRVNISTRAILIIATARNRPA